MLNRSFRSPVLHSLFFAIFPDAETAAQIHSLARDWRDRYGLRGKLHAPDRLHVTLHHILTLPELPAGTLAAAREAAATVTMRPFKICLDRAMSFSNGALVLTADDGAAGAAMLCDDVQKAVAKILSSAKAVSRRPHLTLLYDQKKLAPFEIKPISWMVKDFELIDSHQGITFYDRLDRFPLHGGRYSRLVQGGQGTLSEAPEMQLKAGRVTEEADRED